MPKSQIKANNWVVKQNALNEMRTYDMTLQELRLFSVYLSKINPRNKDTRVVRFPLSDFQAIMEFKNPNISYFKKVAKSLLSKIIFEPLEGGGFDAYTIFNRFRVMPSKNGEWYVDVDANEAALPLLFDFQGRYFKYELWNALRLKSKNQLRMYEGLKQHERVGYRVISIEKLKEMLGINKEDYPRFNTFKQDVIDVCQKALSENTDISFTYEPHGRKGRGGKILELKFTITKNKDYIDPLSLDKFIEINNENITENNFNDLDENGNLISTGTSPIYEERITFLMDACNNEFSREQIVVLFDNMPDSVKHDENDSHDYLQSKYREMDMRKPEKSRFGYLKKLITEEA